MSKTKSESFCEYVNEFRYNEGGEELSASEIDELKLWEYAEYWHVGIRGIPAPCLYEERDDDIVVAFDDDSIAQWHNSRREWYVEPGTICILEYNNDGGVFILLEGEKPSKILKDRIEEGARNLADQIAIETKDEDFDLEEEIDRQKEKILAEIDDQVSVAGRNLGLWIATTERPKL